MPERVCIEETVTFSLQTTPGNTCYGAVVYQDLKDVWVGPNFDPIVADHEGLCTWNWQVAGDAKPGRAAFRAMVQGYGDVIGSGPQSFYIERCNTEQ